MARQPIATQTERLARLETQNESNQARLDKGDNHFEALTKMISDLEKELKKEVDEIKLGLAKLGWLNNPVVIGLIAASLIFAGVGLTLSVMLGVDVTSQIQHIREVVK